MHPCNTDGGYLQNLGIRLSLVHMGGDFAFAAAYEVDEWTSIMDHVNRR